MLSVILRCWLIAGLCVSNVQTLPCISLDGAQQLTLTSRSNQPMAEMEVASIAMWQATQQAVAIGGGKQC
jgi:hypothetical protein